LLTIQSVPIMKSTWSLSGPADLHTRLIQNFLFLERICKLVCTYIARIKNTPTIPLLDVCILQLLDQ